MPLPDGRTRKQILEEFILMCINNQVQQNMFMRRHALTDKEIRYVHNEVWKRLGVNPEMVIDAAMQLKNTPAAKPDN